MKLIKTRLIIVFLIFIFSNCSDQEFVDVKSDSETSKGRNLTNEWETNAYKLNVVYFVPSDISPITDYEKRIEEILFDTQEFFAHNFEREGYGRISFGLNIKNNGKLNILTVTGQQGKDAYPYNGGGSTVINELNIFFNNNPDLKKSEHTLVIMPSTSNDPMAPGGVPFYGLGKYCFALDYEYFDLQYLGQNNQLGNLATKWIGGMVHELGHGLNGPHNKEWKSLQQNLGTALMGAGNYSYGKTPTFITSSSLAIFANSQTFSPVSKPNWYTNVHSNINKLKGWVENNKIIISGNFTSTENVNDIIVWHDPYPAGGNLDYDAVSFTSKPIGSDSLYIESPLSDFYNFQGEYQLRISFIHENGTRTTQAYEYEFLAGTPNIEAINTKDLLDRSTWTILEADSEEDNGAANQLLDGYTNTFWHTEWKNYDPNLPHPHHFVLDMGGNTTIKGFAFENRSNLTGSIKDLEIMISNDGVTWTSIGTHTLKQIQAIQYIDLTEDLGLINVPLTTRYFKFITQNSYDNQNYTHLAEIYAY